VVAAAEGVDLRTTAGPGEPGSAAAAARPGPQLAAEVEADVADDEVSPPFAFDDEDGFASLEVDEPEPLVASDVPDESGELGGGVLVDEGALLEPLRLSLR
jgi:hypothetical protein